MKKLMCALVVAGMIGFAVAEEAAAPESELAKTAEMIKGVTKKVKLTPEEKAQLKAERRKLMEERRAEMEAKLLEVVKKYVPEEEKAKALVDELNALGVRTFSHRRAPKAK